MPEDTTINIHQQKKENPETSPFYVEQLKYLMAIRDGAYDKLYEIMALISAGSVAVIIGLMQDKPNDYLKTALVLMVLTVGFCLSVFNQKGLLFTEIAEEYIAQNDEKERKKGSSKVSRSRKIVAQSAVVSFFLSNLLMLYSVLC